SGFAGTGSSNNDILRSLGGPNKLIGLGGDDVYYVSNGGDQVLEGSGAGNDTVVALVDFTMPENVEGLWLYGSGLTGTGSSNDDILVSCPAPPAAAAASGGPNTLIGLVGNDAYYVYNTEDLVIEDANGGSDTVVATVDYTLPANVEAMYMI